MESLAFIARTSNAGPIRRLIEKLHHRYSLATPPPRLFALSRKPHLALQRSKLHLLPFTLFPTHTYDIVAPVADTTTSTKRDQPADTNGSAPAESASKKQKVETEAPKMSALRLGSVAPDFEAKTTQGPIKFHDFIDGSWAILFS